LGYSRSNNGSEVKYNDLIPPRPLPRMARLGYSLTAGLGISVKDTPIQVFEGYWSVEANDILVEEDGNSFSYQGLLGDIDISKNIIKAQGDEKVITRIGYGIELFETIYLAGGLYEGAIYSETHTFGYGIRTKGIFRFFRTKYTKNWLSFIVDNMDFQFYSSTYTFVPEKEVEFHGIIVSISGF